MFQVTGAEKDNDNRTYFDYSRDPAPSASANTLDKNHVSDGLLIPQMSYRTAWFAPTTFAGATAAKRYCNGTPFGSNPNPNMARFNGPLTTDLNDYNVNGITNSDYAQDLNLDGPGTPALLTGYNDWLHFALNQLGSGKDLRGFSSTVSS